MPLILFNHFSSLRGVEINNEGTICIYSTNQRMWVSLDDSGSIIFRNQLVCNRFAIATFFKNINWKPYDWKRHFHLNNCKLLLLPIMKYMYLIASQSIVTLFFSWTFFSAACTSSRGEYRDTYMTWVCLPVPNIFLILSLLSKKQLQTLPWFEFLLRKGEKGKSDFIVAAEAKILCGYA